MELYFLDKDFNVIRGPVDEFTSAVWSERYFECGSFTLHLPRELFREVNTAVYARTGLENGHVKCGRIEYISVGMEDGADTEDCEIGGRLLEALLDDRIITGKGCVRGDMTSAVISAVRENLRDCGVILGECVMLSDEVCLTYDWDNLSEWLYSVLRPIGASYRVELDTQSRIPVFSLVRGADRSSDERGADIYNAEQAVFSTSFGNINSFECERDENGFRNFLYAEGTDGTVVTVDNSGGGVRKELHRRITDVRTEDFSQESDYRTALYTRGMEILADCSPTVCVFADCDSSVPPKYGEDYRLGDICDVSAPELGLSFSLRLTSLDDVTENNKRTLYPHFGQSLSVAKLLKS